MAKTLTAEMAAECSKDLCDYLRRIYGDGSNQTHPPLDAIAYGAHEVIDRAEKRALSIDALTTLHYVLLNSDGWSKSQRVKAAMAEIEESLKP